MRLTGMFSIFSVKFEFWTQSLRMKLKKQLSPKPSLQISWNLPQCLLNNLSFTGLFRFFICSSNFGRNFEAELKGRFLPKPSVQISSSSNRMLTKWFVIYWNVWKKFCADRIFRKNWKLLSVSILVRFQLILAYGLR